MVAGGSYDTCRSEVKSIGGNASLWSSLRWPSYPFYSSIHSIMFTSYGGAMFCFDSQASDQRRRQWKHRWGWSKWSGKHTNEESQTVQVMMMMTHRHMYHLFTQNEKKTKNVLVLQCIHRVLSYNTNANTSSTTSSRGGSAIGLTTTAGQSQHPVGMLMQQRLEASFFQQHPFLQNCTELALKVSWWG